MDRAFVADEQGRQIHVLDLSAWKLVGSLETEGTAPLALAIDAEQTTLAVLSVQARTLYVMDASSGRVHAKASDLRPGAAIVQFSHGGGRVFAAGGNPRGGIGVIDLSDLPKFDQVVYASDRGSQPPQLFTVGLHDKTSMQITHNRAANVCPCWSRDGQHIAFLSYASGSSKVHTIDRDGQNEVVFPGTDPLATDSAAGPAGRLLDWSPDGSQIAFIQQDQMAIRVVDCQSKSVSTLFDARTDGDDARSRISNLSWADDNRLYFSYHGYADSTNMEIFSVVPDSGEVTGPITDTPDNARCDAPTATSDGRIAVVLNRGVYDRSIGAFLVDHEQSAPDRWRQLTPTWNFDVCCPQWLPDGRRLAFSVGVGGRHRLYIVDTQTGRTLRLAANGWKEVGAPDDQGFEPVPVQGNWSDGQPDVWSGFAERS